MNRNTAQVGETAAVSGDEDDGVVCQACEDFMNGTGGCGIASVFRSI